MKIKIKYLLWSLLFWFWLLINQSFWVDFDIQLVNTQFDTTFENANYSKSYSYLFRERFETTCYTYEGQNLYNLYAYWYSITNTPSWIETTLNNSSSNNSVCTNLGWKIWSDSYYWWSPFTGTCADYWRYPSSLYKYLNVKPQPWSQNSSSSNCISPRLKFLFWDDVNSWQVFSIFDRQTLPNTTKFPVFWFWDKYFSYNTWTEVLSSNMNNWLRLFYNSPVWTNVLYDKEFVDVEISDENTPVFWWEYFTNTQTLTNHWYIVDSNWYKWKHFGSLGYWYSFVYNKDLSLTWRKISWNTLWFWTVWDSILRNLRAFWGLDLMNTNFVDWYTDWILVLRKNQYTNNWNDGVILISKNPDNTKQLLYQEFSCQTNNIKCLFQGLVWNSDWSINNYCPDYVYPSWNASDYSWYVQGTSYTPCMVLWQWILTYSWSSDVLPFSSKKSLVNISDSPILSYFFNNSTSLWNVYSTSSQLCFWNWICFWKTSSSDSIKENYLDWRYDNPYEYVTSWQLQNWTYELCMTNAYFATVNYEICHWLNPSNIITISGADYIITDIQYPDGMTLKQAIPLTDYLNWTTTTLSNWIEVSICSDNNPCLDSSTWSVYFSWWILGTWFYNFDNTWLFFKCPYPYDSLLSLKWWNFNFWDFDIIGPINCMIAWFQHWKSFNAFDNVWLFNFWPLMDWNTQQHRILFRFFDFLLIFWFVLIFSLIYKRFK